MKIRDDRRRYPVTCVLRGHRWFRYPGAQGWYRFGQCRRCEHVEPTTHMCPACDEEIGDEE